MRKMFSAGNLIESDSVSFLFFSPLSGRLNESAVCSYIVLLSFSFSLSFVFLLSSLIVCEMFSQVMSKHDHLPGQCYRNQQTLKKYEQLKN